MPTSLMTVGPRKPGSDPAGDERAAIQFLLGWILRNYNDVTSSVGAGEGHVNEASSPLSTCDLSASTTGGNYAGSTGSIRNPPGSPDRGTPGTSPPRPPRRRSGWGCTPR